MSSVSSKYRSWWKENYRGLFLTCALADQSAEFGTEENIDVIEDELHNNRLNAHFHEGRGSTKTRWLNLFRPVTFKQEIINDTTFCQEKYIKKEIFARSRNLAATWEDLEPRL